MRKLRTGIRVIKKNVFIKLSGARDLTDSADSHIQQIEDLEDLLSVKQMMIEILLLLDHHHHSVIPRVINVDKIARYVLALGKLETSHISNLELQMMHKF